MENDQGRPKLSFEHHAGFYRRIQPNVDGLSTPWEWSPVSSVSHPTSLLHPVSEVPNPSLRVSRVSSSPSSTTVAHPTKGRKRRILLDLLRRVLLLASDETLTSSTVSTRQTTEDGLRDAYHCDDGEVQPHEWKQYGYWACPSVDGVPCSNSPANSEYSINTIELKSVVEAVRNPRDHDDVHPECWIPGLKHPSLPSKPSRWKTPIPGIPLPFPWEVQINPLLRHLLWGSSPLSWYIGADPSPRARTVFYGNSSAIPWAEADATQPATWPFLTHMYFNAIAGDGCRTFPWSFTIHNPRGIKMIDVLLDIHHHLQEPLIPGEYDSWPALRQAATDRAFLIRMDLYSNVLGQPFQDMKRRYDSFGGNMYFRGIEPSVDGGGWMITLGAY